MNKNVGRLDQVIRGVTGIIFFYFGFIDSDFIPDNLSSTIIGIIGILLMLVAVFRYCPLYTKVNINTLKSKR